MTKDENKLSVNITQVLPPAPQQDFVVGVETETDDDESEEQEQQESEEYEVEWNP